MILLASDSYEVMSQCSARIQQLVCLVDERMATLLGPSRTEQIRQTDISQGHASASLHAAGKDRARTERSFDDHQRDSGRFKHRGQLYRQYDEGRRDLELSIEGTALGIVHHLQKHLG